MEAPSSIFCLSCKKVVLDLDPSRFWYRCLRYVPADDDSWKEEQRSAIFACPVSGGELEVGIEDEAVVNRLGRLRGRREVG